MKSLTNWINTKDLCKHDAHTARTIQKQIDRTLLKAFKQLQKPKKKQKRA